MKTLACRAKSNGFGGLRLRSSITAATVAASAVRCGGQVFIALLRSARRKVSSLPSVGSANSPLLIGELIDRSIKAQVRHRRELLPAKRASLNSPEETRLQVQETRQAELVADKNFADRRLHRAHEYGRTYTQSELLVVWRNVS